MKSENKKSPYKGVSSTKIQGKLIWRVSILHNGERRKLGTYPFTIEGERAAAKAYDLARIKLGLEPVNILKKKQ